MFAAAVAVLAKAFAPASPVGPHHSGIYDVTAAKKIASRLLSVQDFEGAGFTENGRRIIEVGEGIRFLSVPELTITFEVPGGHSELHQTAHRALTIRNVTPKKQDAPTELELTLIDIDREKVIGTLPSNEAMVRIPQIAFGANGQKMSLSLAGTRVWDTTINKVILLENGEFPEHDRYAPGPAYFSADGNSICVEQMGAMRAISITNVPKGTARHCFIVPREGRPWASEVSRADFSAKLVHIPVTPGMTQPPGMFGLYYRVTREALSPDERLAAVIEQSSKTGNPTNEAWLVIADMETGRVEHRVALPPISVELRQFDVRFTPDGRVVVVWYGEDEKGVAFDVQSGAPVGIPTNYKRPDE